MPAPTSWRITCARSASGPRPWSGCASSARSSCWSGCIGMLKAGRRLSAARPATIRPSGWPTCWRMRARRCSSRSRALLRAAAGHRARIVQPRRRRAGDRAHARHLRQPSSLAPHNTAYVIYTSGSTGQPKGVADPASERGAAVRRHAVAGSSSGPRTCGPCSTRSRSTSRSGRSGERCCTAGDSSCVPHAVSRAPRLPRAAGARAGDGAQPDAVGVLPADAGGAEQPELGQALALRQVIFGGEALDLRRLERLVPAACRARAGAGQHVRHHRDDGACHLPGARPGDRRAPMPAA